MRVTYTQVRRFTRRARRSFRQRLMDAYQGDRFLLGIFSKPNDLSRDELLTKNWSPPYFPLPEWHEPEDVDGAKPTVNKWLR